MSNENYLIKIDIISFFASNYIITHDFKIVLGEDKIGRNRLLQFIANSFEYSNNEMNSTTTFCYDNTYIPHDSTIPGNILLTTILKSCVII